MRALCFCLLLAGGSLLGQDTGTSRRDVYKADIAVRDTEPGGKANIRRFSMLIEEGGTGKVNSGGRLPFAVGSGNWNWMDVGVRLTCKVRETREQLMLNLNADINDIVGGTSAASATTAPPSQSHHSVEVDTSVTPGKPTTLLTWDDPSSKRRYEIEATVTKSR